jgi:predicted kinase
MKDTIKNILREGTLKNSLGVTVTRPNQKLIVLRGIPGAGKSTKAKELVGEGIIHSTDDLIESQGDYRKFFSDMISSGNFGPLSEMHKQNYLNAVNSMESGITTVIIDNTNIRPSEAKNYVESALNLGYSDDNIKFVDIGTGGLLAEQLAERNTHGVPLDKIKSMIQAHQSAGELTLEKVLNAKDMYPKKNKKFASVVLTEESRDALLENVSQYIPEGWKVIAHHMTINFGDGLPDNLRGDLGKAKMITATEIGISDMAIAVKVMPGKDMGDVIRKAGKIPHVTIALNPNGGKPVMSNDITNWSELPKRMELVGVVTEEDLK